MSQLLTQSTIKDFERCKRRWWLRHVRRLAGAREYKSYFMVGNVVHDALAEWYAGGLDDGPLQLVRAAAEEAIGEAPDMADQILKDAELAGIMVEGYLEWLEETGADYELEAVSPERELRMELAPGIELMGKLDAHVRRRDGWTGLLEHKTVGNFTDLPALARMDRQLLTYELLEYLELLEGMEPAKARRAKPRTAGAILNMLRKVKRTARANPPFYQREEVLHNVDQLRSHWMHVVAIARDMDEREERLAAGEDHHAVVPPNPTIDCRWSCEFFSVCPMFDDGSDAESVLADEFEESDPLERYQEREKK